LGKPHCHKLEQPLHEDSVSQASAVASFFDNNLPVAVTAVITSTLLPNLSKKSLLFMIALF